MGGYALNALMRLAQMFRYDLPGAMALLGRAV